MANISNTASANQAAFGAFGSAFTDTGGNTLRPPEGLSIVAIQFLADTVLDSLVAKNANVTINTVSASHTDGLFTRKVNQGTASTNQIAFDDTNAASGVAIGDEIYQTTGVLLGTVTALDPDGDNASEIQYSTTTTITDDEVLSFIRPNVSSGEGVGGQAIGTGSGDQKFPKGMTIYGRWDAVSMQATSDADGGIIVYFGP